MASCGSIEQQLSALPVFQASPKFIDGTFLLGTITEWMRRGVKSALCVFCEGRSAIFFGPEGQLFEIGKTWQGEELSSPREVMYGRQAWRLPQALDLSSVTLSCTDNCVFILDSQMQLHAICKESPMSRILPNRHVAQVACSAQHALVLTSSGEVYSCGSNADGQLGLGHDSPTAELSPVDIWVQGRASFGTWVAVGARHSVVLCEQESIMTFGSNSHCQLGHNEDTSQPHPVPGLVPPDIGGPFVRAACGAEHSLFLTSTGELYGCGSGACWQLGSIGTDDLTLTKLPFELKAGARVVDVYCHPHEDASVLLTDSEQFYACGRVGELFGISGLVEDFLLYKADAVLLGPHLLCTKLQCNRVCIPGFDDPEFCDVELVSTKQEPECTNPTWLEEDILHKLPPEALRKLLRSALQEGSAKSPKETLLEQLLGLAEPEVCTSQAPGTRAAFLGYDCIKMRSPYLWQLLQNPCQCDLHTEGRSCTLRVQKYSSKAWRAYGHYLHHDFLDAEPEVAIELLELARESQDDALAEQCRRAARRKVGVQDLAACLRGCIEQGHLSLGADLVKLRLCQENCCDVLRVAERGPEDKPGAEYIRDLAMAFAAKRPEAVLESKAFAAVEDRIRGRMLCRLGALGLLGGPTRG